MAQQEVGTIMYQVKTEGEKHIDLSTGLGIANAKQYHQFSKSGRPLCYHATIEVLTASKAVPVATAPKSYPVVNALVKTSVGWKHQMDSAGYDSKNLSRYARRLRVALTDDSVDDNGQATNTMEPYSHESYTDGVGTAYDEQDNAAGDAIPFKQIAEVTTMVIPSATEGTAPDEIPAVILSGSSAADVSAKRFRTLKQWQKDRMGTAVEPDEGREVDPANLMARLFSGAQPETDEIVTELEEFQEFRPYNTANFQYRYQDWGTIGQLAVDQKNAVTVEAPCGLIQLGGLGLNTSTRLSANDRVIITVHSIYEM